MPRWRYSAPGQSCEHCTIIGLDVDVRATSDDYGACMSKVAVLQQQASRIDLPDPGDTGPWRYWTPAEIASAAQCPLVNVLTDWPGIYSAFYGMLGDYSILTRSVQAAVIATTAIETASTFKPVREAFWLDDVWGYDWAEAWRSVNLRYWPYYGRGYVQLTWQSNYQAEGDAIGVDLVSNPDRALESWIAADAEARFFITHGVTDAALAHDWPEVRRRVQGAYAGLDRLQRIVAQLGA